MKNIIIILIPTFMFFSCLAEYNSANVNEKRKGIERYSKKIKEQINDRLSLEREEFVYSNKDLADPFKTIFMRTNENVGMLMDKTYNVATPKNVSLTELQRFEIEEFKLSGLIYGTILNDRRGLLKDPTGKTHVVKEGDIVGKNYGKIYSIKKDRIEIKEVTYDAHGGQKFRKIKIDLEKE